MSLKKFIILPGLIVLLLGGCSNESTAEKIYGHLEETVALEKEFKDQQKQVAELEDKEQEIYSKIVKLSTDEMDKVKKLSNEALSVLEEKEKQIDEEKESIESAKEEFSNVEPMIDNLEKESALTEAENLVNVMNKRYDSYTSLYESYKKAVEQDRKLYEMMKKEDLKVEDLKSQIQTINRIYDKVLTANQTFNEKTEEYNQLKKDFYETAGLQVEYKNQEKAAS